VRRLELPLEQILHDEHVVGLHIHDATRALPLHLQLGRTALVVFRDQHVVSHLKVFATAYASCRYAS
jgi:hypothetical protein